MDKIWCGERERSSIERSFKDNLQNYMEEREKENIKEKYFRYQFTVSLLSVKFAFNYHKQQRYLSHLYSASGASKSIPGQLKRSDDDRLSGMFVRWNSSPGVVFLAERARFLFRFRAITRAKLDDGEREEKLRPFNLAEKKEGIMSGRDLKAN